MKLEKNKVDKNFVPLIYIYPLSIIPCSKIYLAKSNIIFVIVNGESGHAILKSIDHIEKRLTFVPFPFTLFNYGFFISNNLTNMSHKKKNKKQKITH